MLTWFSSRIDLKVSSCPQGYQPQEAQAIMKEVHSLRDAISSGEKEKQALIQVSDTHSTSLYRLLLSRSLSLPSPMLSSSTPARLQLTAHFVRICVCVDLC